MDSHMREYGPPHNIPGMCCLIGIEGVAGASYYAFTPHPDWRFVALDAYDVSMLGWPPGHPNHEAAMAILDERNPNEVCVMPLLLAAPLQ